ncbi:MAG: putative ABC transporter permease [Clostridia bacterium]
MSYSATQWVFIFFVYCFSDGSGDGSTCRSARGSGSTAAHGPFLPIYGSGAVVILLSTLGVRDNLLLIYIFGMIGSTILEYCTGAAMQRMFGVRYWDYSKRAV